MQNSPLPTPHSPLPTPHSPLIPMIRIRHILDPDLKRKVIDKLADARGMSSAAVPEWFELDDADFVDLLNAIRDDEAGGAEDDRDPRM